MNLPRIGITMGDPAGVGPEVVMKAMARAETHALCRALVIGDAKRLERAGAICGLKLAVRRIGTADEARFERGAVDCLDLGLIPPELPFGKVSAEAGEAAYRYVERAVKLALDKQMDAICTAPLNKEAMNAAGHHFPGHTELLAQLTGTAEVSLTLLAPKLRVIHVTAHIGLLDAIEPIDAALVGRTIVRGRELLLRAGHAEPRIGVFGINPHAGEGGLFGRGEEEAKIVPAVAEARARGGQLTPEIPVYFIGREEYFDREFLYGTPKGDYFDNAERFIFYSRAVLVLAQRLKFSPDILHHHEWHTGLISAYLQSVYREDPTFSQTAVVFTIHNLAYQGLFVKEKLSLTGLPPEMYNPEGLEFWERINLMKAGIVYGDVINTVSKKYSEEIQTPEFGYGLGWDFEKEAARPLWNPQRGRGHGVRDPVVGGGVPLAAHGPSMPGRGRRSRARVCVPRSCTVDGVAGDDPASGAMIRSMRLGPYVALLRGNPAFTRLYVAQLISFAGDWFTQVALLGLVLQLTGSPAAASLLLVLQSAPFFLLSPLAGAVADRLDRRRVMVAVDLLRALAALALLLADDSGSLWIAFVATAGIAAGGAFFEPASAAALPNLVARDDLPVANVLMGAAWGTMLAVGAAIGGLVAALLGRDAAFLLDALSFLVSALLIVGIRGLLRSEAAKRAFPSQVGAPPDSAGIRCTSSASRRTCPASA